MPTATVSHTPAAGLRPQQLDLFAGVLTAYMDGKPKTNQQLYESLVAGGYLTEQELQERAPVGRDGSLCSIARRRARWLQQDLRAAGVLERIPDQRGTWRLANRDKKDLTRAAPGVTMLGFSTKLGLALWGSCTGAFGSMTDLIAAVITSPPYALAQPRAYGNVSQDEYVDWLCLQLEPLVKRLIPGGSICINLGDVFEPGLPCKSLIKPKFIIAAWERLGLKWMGDSPWINPNKPPGPVAWASKERMQLAEGYESVLIFCNDPLRSIADNRRVLQPHTEQHLKLIARGGEQRARVSSDGAYRIRKGSYANPTPGRIPRNVLVFSGTCPDQRRLRRKVRAAGLPVHGASMPLALALFLVQFLSRPGDLIVDPFGGSLTTGRAAETLGRMWMASEIMAEYLLGARLRFTDEELADREELDLLLPVAA